MAIYDARSIPDTVTSGTEGPESAEWLKTGPVLGGLPPMMLLRAFDPAC